MIGGALRWTYFALLVAACAISSSITWIIAQHHHRDHPHHHGAFNPSIVSTAMSASDCSGCAHICSTTSQETNGVLQDDQSDTAVFSRLVKASSAFNVCGEGKRVVTQYREQFGLKTFAFFTKKCSLSHPRPLSELVTIVTFVPQFINEVKWPSLEAKLTLISRALDDVSIVLFAPSTEIKQQPSPFRTSSHLSIRFFDVSNPHSLANELLHFAQSATTPYALIAPHGLAFSKSFSSDVRLTRLIRVLEQYPELKAVGGSVRSLDDGKWVRGCLLTHLHRYTLTQYEGYESSTADDCIVCHALAGPFVIATSSLRELIDPILATPVPRFAFHALVDDLFLNILYAPKMGDTHRSVHPKKPYRVAVCPDVMFSINGNLVMGLVDVEAHVPFSVKWGIMRWISILEPRREFWFGCPDHLIPSESASKTVSTIQGGPRLGPGSSNSLFTVQNALSHGMLITPCAEAAMKHYVFGLVDICHSIGLHCAIHSGVALGALKFQGPLPWDNDIDIAFAFPVHKKPIDLIQYQPQFAKIGLLIRIKRGLPYRLTELNRTLGISVDLHFPNRREAAEYWPLGFSQVLWAGRWVNVSYNPGKWYREYFGGGIFRHKVLPEYEAGASNTAQSQNNRAMVQCRAPSPRYRHGCLDQYPSDGSHRHHQIAQPVF